MLSCQRIEILSSVYGIVAVTKCRIISSLIIRAQSGYQMKEFGD